MDELGGRWACVVMELNCPGEAPYHLLGEVNASEVAHACSPQAEGQPKIYSELQLQENSGHSHAGRRS